MKNIRSNKDMSKILSMAAKLQKKTVSNQKREFSEEETFVHDNLLPIAREVACKYGIAGATMRQSKNGEFPWIEKDSEASNFVRKLTNVHPYDYNKGANNRRVNELLWVINFLTNPEFASVEWKEIDARGFKFDPLTGMSTEDQTVITPMVNTEVVAFFRNNGIFLNTTQLVKDYAELLVKSLDTKQLDWYLDYLNGSPTEEESEGQEDVPEENVESQTSSEEAPSEEG